ncbi:MAG: hypothetical protein B9S34_07270 [Opitutia bacterium Tous-C1TDCM]|nr:MAG: hypothetical protein B9S34_07270 [Opitutae bacterium Tous-C1TDCM]
MNKNILLAVTSGTIAAAALVLSFRSSVTADSLIGFASVLGLLGIATLEYRINWKRLLGLN